MVEPNKFIGECIYCGSKKSPLTDEHAIPAALGGDIVLLKASCAKCQKATSGMEGYVLGKLLGGYRGGAGYPKRKKKRWKEPISVDVTFTNGTTGTIEVLPGDMPRAICLPTMPPPRFRMGLPQLKNDEAIPGSGFWISQDKPAIARFARKHGIVKADLGKVDPEAWERLLMKMAYCAAVHGYGANGIYPWVVPYILGKKSQLNYFVGGVGGHGNELEADRPIAINTRVIKRNGLVISRVRLFSYLGAPTYQVVLGIRRGYLWRWLKEGLRGRAARFIRMLQAKSSKTKS